MHIDNRAFSWSITVPKNEYVKLEFSDFQMSLDSSFPCVTKLSIYDGLVDFSQMATLAEREVPIGAEAKYLPQAKVSYCGKRLPPKFLSSTNTVTVYLLILHNIVSENRFLLEWSSVNSTIAHSENDKGLPDNVNSTFSIFLDAGQKYNILNENITGLEIFL